MGSGLGDTCREDLNQARGAGLELRVRRGSGGSHDGDICELGTAAMRQVVSEE